MKSSGAPRGSLRRYIAYLKESNGLVENVYALEKAGGFTGKGSPAAFDFTTHRLAAGSQMLLEPVVYRVAGERQPVPEHAPPRLPQRSDWDKFRGAAYVQRHRLSVERSSNAHLIAKLAAIALRDGFPPLSIY